jgi:hypothetical protein
MDENPSSLDKITSNKNLNFQYTSNKTSIVKTNNTQPINISYIRKIEYVHYQENLNLKHNDSDKKISKYIKKILNNSKCNTICYQVAFSQILITYSFFIFSFILIIIYRLNTFNILKKKIKSRKRAGSLP